MAQIYNTVTLPTSIQSYQPGSSRERDGFPGEGRWAEGPKGGPGRGGTEGRGSIQALPWARRGNHTEPSPEALGSQGPTRQSQRSKCTTSLPPTCSSPVPATAPWIRTEAGGSARELGDPAPKVKLGNMVSGCGGQTEPTQRTGGPKGESRRLSVTLKNMFETQTTQIANYTPLFMHQ